MSIRLATAAALAALCFGSASAPGLEIPTRELLASGDLVPGFGRVGTADLVPVGIDANGRVLILSELSDGAEGLFWAADDGVTTAWIADAPGADFARIGAAVTNDQGDVLAGVFATVDRTNDPMVGLYRIRDGVAEAVARRGDVSADGDTICEFGAFAINAAGTVAFEAAPAVDGECADLAPYGLYTVDGKTLSRVAVALPDGAPRALHLLGLAGDGTILANVVDGGRVLALADGATRTVVADNVDGPSGLQIAAVHGTGANAGGDVAFLGWEGDRFGVYRTRGSEIVRVVSVGDATPDGDPITSIDTREPQLGAAGDVVLRVEWSDRHNSIESGALAIAPDGSARFAPHAAFAAVNAAGSVAMFDPSTNGISRWQRDALVPLLRPGDAAPNGAVFAIDGLRRATCLGADGRVGAVASAIDGTSGLLCGDGDGFTTIARAGDPAPEGGRFYALGSCAFAPDGSLLFGALNYGWGPAGDANLYRATTAGIARVAGAGMLTSDGEPIDGLVRADGGPWFEVNARGTVLVGAWIAGLPHLLRVEPGRAPAVMRFDLGGPPFPPLSIDGGIDADDRVYAVAGVSRHASIVVSDGDRGSVLSPVGDLQTPLGPINHVDSVRARGNRVLIFGADAANTPRLLQYTPEGGFADVLPDQGPFRVLDFTEQRTLIETSAAIGAEQLLVDPDGLHRVGARQQPYDPAALAVNDRSNLLFLTTLTPLGTRRHALSLSGPAPEAHCFAPPTAVYSEPPPPTPTPNACVGSGCTHLIVESVGGSAGDAVQLSVTLDSPWFIAGVQGDVATAPPLRVGAKANGRPACRVNPDIAKTGTVFSFQPTGCDPSATCTAVRALVLALDNVDAIPNGAQLFTCDATIAADAAPGHYPITVAEVGVSDPNGVALPCDGIAGDLDVHDSGTEPQQPPVVESGGGVGGGCQVDPRPTNGGALVLAAALLLRVLGWRRSRS